MMSAVEKLRTYPQWYAISIDLEEEQDDDALAQALEQNQHVSEVWLRPRGSNTDWDNLLRVLATRGNLKSFKLSNGFAAERNRPILQAIQQNASLRRVEVRQTNLFAGDLCSFLDTAIHLTDLMLSNCNLEEGAQGARDVAAALQRNTNIVTLEMTWMNGFLDPILEGLVSNTCVRSLVLGMSDESYQHTLTNSARTALRVLLKSTRSIQHLGLVRTIFMNAASFRFVLRAVAASKLKSLSVLNLENQRQVEVLADAIPSMKIRKLVIYFGYSPSFIANLRLWKRILRRAVQNNFTLQSVESNHANDATMEFYLARNTRLAEWLENPDTVPKHLWKEATTLATKTGPNSLYRVLRKIGPEVLPVCRKCDD